MLVSEPGDLKWGVNGHVTEDGKYLVINVSDGTTSRKSRVSYKPADRFDGPASALIDNFDNKWYFVGNDGPVFYFRTEADAPRGRVVAIDTQLAPRDSRGAKWKEIIPQTADTLTGVDWVADRLICTYLHDAHSLVKVHIPLAKFNVWAVRTTLCPEPYVRLSLEPGRSGVWQSRYELAVGR